MPLEDRSHDVRTGDAWNHVRPNAWPKPRTLFRGALVVVLAVYAGFAARPLLSSRGEASNAARPAIRLSHSGSRDQDDMCVWVHPTDRSQSTVIASDKLAERLFVYDLRGRAVQEITAPKPGNVDARSGFSLDGRSVDLVVVNQRIGDPRLLVFSVDPQTRTLSRVDDGDIHTGSNYGGCLYRDSVTGRLYFFATAGKRGVAQYELSDNGEGRVAGRLVRQWPLRKCEAAVADDASGTLFVGEEDYGVWKVGAEPSAPAPGELIIQVGEHGLKGDVEGLAVVRHADGRTWLIVSDQGRDCFMIFDAAGTHEFVGEFSVAGAVETDGIEAFREDLGPDFPGGLFACHTHWGRRPVLLSPWDRVEDAIDRSRNGRMQHAE